MLRSLATLLLTVFAVLATPALGADPFEGKITYGITYDQVPAEVAGLESMLPNELTMWISGTLTRVEQSMMGGKQIVVHDTESGKGFMLMDLMGQKMHIEIDGSAAEKTDEPAAEPQFEPVDGRKNIAGYKCKAAKVTGPDGAVTTVWFTDKLPATHAEFSELEGFPLEYTVAQDGMKMTISATDVDKTPLDDATFTAPTEGYQKLTMEQLEAMGGQ